MKLALTILLYLFGTAFSLQAQTDSVNSRSTEISNDIKKLVEQLSKENMILGRAVSVGAEERPPYKAFKKLVDVASIDELVLLTKHDNPIVRGYAIWGLILRDKEKAEALKSQFYADNAVVETMLHGCIVEPHRLSNFAYTMLKLPEEEMKVYYRKK